jgi:hypothetical protein
MKKDMSYVYDGYVQVRDFMMRRAARFTVLDWALLKTCLVSFGVLISVAFSKFFRRLKPLWVALFVLSWMWLMWRLVVDVCEEDDEF